MRRSLSAVAASVALLVVGSGLVSAQASPASPADLLRATTAGPVAGTPGLDALVADLGADGSVTGIATFDAAPSAADIGALRALGLEVQPMQHLPLAIVRGAVAAAQAAVTSGVANDVYPDESIELLDTASADAMGAALPRSQGLTGEGTTVAVVDSGCDATHPDLADHVTHNVKLLSAEYANVTPDSSNTIVVPVDQGPYSNSDIGSGHGTHVAGIIAADGTTSPDHLGVAPDAELVCLSIGEVLFTTAVVTAYDYLLDQPDLLGVDVVNNSWGNLYAQFDPRNPVAVATKAIADLGVTVVFAAGNSGDGAGEATLNPFSQAPWIISVAAGTLDHQRGGFSSNGYRFDNSQPTAIGAGGRTTFLGERIGLVHPDLTAPGVDISSTCDTIGVAIGPCPPASNETASGTSMASPHVAGAAAVLLEANPSLTPQQIQSALQVTATPVFGTDESGAPTPDVLPFWQVGYGFVDLAAAVDLVTSTKGMRGLERRQARLDEAVLASTGFRTVRSDFATYDAPRVTLGTDQRSYEMPVGADISHVKVTLTFPSEAILGVDLGATEYTVTLTDPGGNVIGTGEQVGIGTRGILVDLAEAGAAPGTYTVSLVGDRAVSDPDTLDSDSLLNDTVTLQVAQLVRRRG